MHLGPPCPASPGTSTGAATTPWLDLLRQMALKWRSKPAQRGEEGQSALFPRGALAKRRSRGIALGPHSSWRLWAVTPTRENRDSCMVTSRKHVLATQVRRGAEKCPSPTVGNRTPRRGCPRGKPSSEGVRFPRRVARRPRTYTNRDFRAPGSEAGAAGARSGLQPPPRRIPGTSPVAAAGPRPALPARHQSAEGIIPFEETLISSNCALGGRSGGPQREFSRYQSLNERNEVGSSAD